MTTDEIFSGQLFAILAMFFGLLVTGKSGDCRKNWMTAILVLFLIASTIRTIQEIQWSFECVFKMTLQLEVSGNVSEFRKLVAQI